MSRKDIVNEKSIVSKELVIDVSSSEVSIALLEDKKLTELTTERSNVKFSVGDIYLGKVKKIMPGLNAAFIDVGYEKDAFLHYLDLGPQFQSLNKYLQQAINRKGKVGSLSKFKLEPDIRKDGKIGQVLQAGQLVVVQIAKEPISTKGPRLGSEISIPGRNLVLMPFSDKISVSTKIKSSEEKIRLRKLLESILPKNYGVIVRTAAEGKKVAELDLELKNLQKKWEVAFEKLKEVKVPKLFISELNRTVALLRDILNLSFNSIFVNDDEMYRELKEYISSIYPEKEKIVKIYKGRAPIFEQFSIEKQIKSSFGKTVSFKNGAYLIIEHTEALHVIDVNSGNRAKLGEDQESNALEVNLAAAEEIARQLRLRDMGGIIVVDFIDMHEQEHKQMLFEKMKEAMAEDRTKHNILPLSKFGLMQITRQRVRPELTIQTLEKCPTCQGTGEVMPTLLFDEELKNKARYIIERENLKKLTIKLHPYVAGYLNKGIFSMARQWGRKFNCRIKVESMQSNSFLEYKFYNKNNEEIIL